MVVTQAEFQEWRGSNVTQTLFKAIRKERERMKEILVTNGYSLDDEREVKGRCAAAAALLDLTYETLMEEAYGE